MDLQNLNPSSLKSRFTARFLRALTEINAPKTISSSSPREIFQRYRRIKVAADKSMAYSVRSRRIWSRATLWRLRTRSRSRRLVSFGRRASVKTRTTASHGKENKEHHGAVLGVQAEELRELVPGGEAMDLCNLLDETAHYIKCLTTQVQVMRTIANLYSIE
ncbi:putative sodium-bile acid cotransporter [Hibiscus syriacus]|uniref:Putative sodium-bile acid cotransporter n=1 Tax=Hibiscus syriacus TaxID=106335 RepID=A0A6A2XXG8_HIBSY|nr:transcription factor IBH1-like isoform X1 [Hibiscus syriacus]XP_039045402.1 transcription factor IBH1-like isoform X2 [Hibiscus syriacus]KAE8663239.1 putative sodium-bile acid cotransporter [Hibiscus syriacus]KAE8692120.1 putative sodium-bile acid cotransporter [Hibiscus syriacus]